MADKSITDLNEATQLFDNGLMVVYQSGETKKMQGQALKQYVQAAADVDAAKDAADRAQAAAATIESKVTRAETASANAESFAGQASTANGAAQTAKTDAESAADRAEAALSGVVTPDLKVGTVTTLSAGSKATVTRRAGSPNSAPVFDFGIPKGEDGSGAVTSVNGKSGAVVLAASDVGARPDSWTPSKEDVRLGNVANERQYSAENPPPYPVTSVNGQTGDVVIESGGIVLVGYNTQSYSTIQAAINANKLVAVSYTTDGDSAKQYRAYYYRKNGDNYQFLAFAQNGAYMQIYTISPENVWTFESLKQLNRANPVNEANTDYTTFMARGEALFNADTNPTVNGTIAWMYE